MHILFTGNTTFKIANFREGLIRHLIGNGHQVTVLAPNDEYVKFIMDLGCNFVPLKMDRKGKSLLSEARLLAQIFANLREIQPDVVFSFTVKNNIYCGLTTQILKIPFVPNVTGLGPAFNNRGPLNRFLQTLFKLAFRRAHTVFFQNTSDRETFYSLRLISQHQAYLLPGSGINLDKFSPSAIPSSENGIHFLLVARLLWEKGVGTFADAAEQLRKKFPNTTFSVLGPFDSDSASGIDRETVDDWVSRGHLNYLGATQDVLPFVQAAHCIVLPSYYREGTPRSLIEGAACGRPIITTDLPGCRDLVDRQENGFLVNPQDASDLEKTMEEFLKLSDKERTSMGRASRALAEKKFDEQIVIEAYDNILNDFAPKFQAAQVV